jgi:Putative beta-lactamase-inhibitor-like, PepSY-like
MPMRLFVYSYIIVLCALVSCDRATSFQNDKNASSQTSGSVEDSDAIGKGILQTFTTQYPKAQDIVWDTIDIGYVANFSNGNNDCKAFYDKKGQFQYTTTLVTDENIPSNIQAELKKRYKSYTIAIIQEVFDGKTKLLQIEIETDKDYIALEFDEKGKFLKELKHPLSTEEIQQQEEEGVDENEK